LINQPAFKTPKPPQAVQYECVSLFLSQIRLRQHKKIAEKFGSKIKKEN